MISIRIIENVLPRRSFCAILAQVSAGFSTIVFPMVKIYLSYRREDSGKDAGRIYDHLVKEFGQDKLFKDIDTTVGIGNFAAVMKLTVAKCDVMLVLIGPNWLDNKPDTGKRYIDIETDTVRQEVLQGLRQQKVRVIPVILAPATPPHPDDLPPMIQNLAFQNAAMVRDDPDFHRDMTRLIASINNKATTLNLTPAKTEKVKQPRTISLLQWLLIFIIAAMLFCGVVAGVFLFSISNIFEPPTTSTATITPSVIHVQSSRIVEVSRTPTLVSVPKNPEIAGLPNFVSSPLGWVNRGDTCAGIQSTNLQAPTYARHTVPQGVSIRTEPSLQARQFGGIAANDDFVVLSGSICNENHEWWLVNYYGSIGWATGANRTERWLETVPDTRRLEPSYEWIRDAAYTPFEGGHMFWIDGFRQIFVLYTDSHTWAVYLDEWRDGDTEFDTNILPPAGFYQPERGFGLVWRNQPDVRTRLSWALATEHGYETVIAYHFGQDMNNLATYTALNGFRMIESPTGGIFTLHDNGQWE